MRASMAASRQSQAPGAIASAAATAKLLEKKKEYEAVAALERASAQFLKRIEDIGEDFDVIADAGIVHGQVLEQWPNMFRILSLFLSQREQHTEDESAPAPAAGERLVRVPIEELRQTESKAT
ncbi:uncharacterized protein TRAVEDRAFT_69284 [Trametes versicolor FP-101664 SS1]|uniref:uncharacterized protein n=1 Tax=Trametes versicolor (strain FP-101664) TaxID=717944 RepID=UPI00046215A4|nr:uncharacterized protein TRAVEDRAFT_69284 [Trametes versicolor FP-101664 SS1]EIW63186.1 hypothetical protein TRAVEDRAFT_69284 [Trametes versicolor FP-101664 SS1]